MVTRVRHDHDSCPVARAVDLVGDRWSLLIVRDAFDGITRFGDLRASLGVAKNILSARLQALIEHGIMQTVPASDGSAYREYILTDRGRDLFTVVVALRQWGEANLFDEGEDHSVLVDAKHERPLGRLHAVDATGRLVAPDTTYVQKLGSSD